LFKGFDQLTDKMSDSDESFDILRDIKPYSFESLTKKVIDSSNCEEHPAPVHNKIWIGVYFLLLV